MSDKYNFDKRVWTPLTRRGMELSGVRETER